MPRKQRKIKENRKCLEDRLKKNKTESAMMLGNEIFLQNDCIMHSQKTGTILRDENENCPTK